ncbi:MAG TPA: lipoyl(octanoyl) transferase LipB [Desulfomonilaceae bacterium]|nr:lipoyl(octanoyl) transferase LipB [Desulfomonilaceae bacterium]
MLLVELQQVEYLATLNLQYRIVERKIRWSGPDVLLLLEHPHTITLGTRGKHAHVLASAECLLERGIALHSVDRGGEATYHGPGQLVAYPIMDLRRLGVSVREYVRALEETILGTLRSFGIQGFRQHGKVGIWTGINDKIASIGVRIRKRVTYHGFSLNVDLELDPAELVVSCGMPSVHMVSLNQVTPTTASMASVRHAVAGSFSAVFGVDLQTCSAEDACS